MEEETPFPSIRHPILSTRHPFRITTATILAPTLDALVGADTRPQALLSALTRSLPRRSACVSAIQAFLVLALLALVGAGARTRTLLTLAPAAAMPACLRSPAFPARALDALVGADTRPQALHALAPLAICSHICEPPHSLHSLSRRLWEQMPEPRQSTCFCGDYARISAIDLPQSLHVFSFS